MSGTLQWFKSSYSHDSGGDCVEIAFDWHKSSYSNPSGGECVEVAQCGCADADVHIRDTKTPDGAVLTVPAAAWAAFTTYAR